MRLVPLLILFFITSAAAQNKNLDYYISAGLANSPLLRDYNNQLLLNGIDSQRLRAYYHPVVNATSNNMAAPVINGWGYDQVLTNNGNYTTTVNVNQTFIGRKNLDAQYYSIQLLSDSFRNAQKMSEQELKRSIIAQYITAYGDQQQLSFNLTVNELLGNQEILLKKLTQNNVYRQTDYLTFLVTLKQQELQLKQLRIQFHVDFATLNYLCGIFDTSSATLDAPALVLQYPPDEATSVFFQHYRRDSINLENTIRILNYSYRPRLSAFANAGYSSSLMYQAQKNFGFSLGVNVAVPIYDGHLRKLQTDKIRIIQNSGLNYKDFFARQYAQQLAMLRQQLSSTEDLIKDIDEQVKYADGLIDVNKKLLQTGDSKIADYVIAINSYLTARNLLTQNNISRMQIINQLNYWNR
jgi:outer membrane protein TolC